MSESRRLLFIEHHPIFGGPHNRAIRLARPLREVGWETVAVVPQGPGTVEERYRAAAVPVIKFPLGRLRRSPYGNLMAAARFSGDVARIRRAIREHRIDLVVVAGLESPHGIVAARLENVPAVWQVIGTRTPMWFRLVAVALARRLAEVVMTTGTTIAREHPGIESLRERWVPFLSPVDTDEFAPSFELRRTARVRLGLQQHDLVIGTVGNVNPQKGHMSFVRAASLIRREHSNAKFVILGVRDQNHRQYQAELGHLARSLGLELGVDLIVRDPLNDVAGLARAFDIFWSTSIPRSEGVPTSVMEAMALALPIVATDVGGTRDVVRDGVTGFIVPPLSPRAIAQATVNLLERRGSAAILGRAGREFVIEHCSVDVCTRTHAHAFDIATRVHAGQHRFGAPGRMT